MQTTTAPTTTDRLRADMRSIRDTPLDVWTGQACSECHQPLDGNDECETPDCEGSGDRWQPYAVEYITTTETGKHRITGVRLMVAGGGPDIWIEAREGRLLLIEGAWWGDYQRESGPPSDEVMDYYRDLAA